MPAPTAAASEADFERRLEKVMSAVDLHHTHLQDYLYRLTGQWQDAQDILQRVWIVVLHRFDLENIDSLPLLRRKAYQLFVDHYRAARRRPEMLTAELPELPTNAGHETSFSAESEAVLKTRFFDDFPGLGLSDAQKAVLWEHGRYGKTYQEIERELGVPASTVCDWIALGRERLAEHLNHNQG